MTQHLHKKTNLKLRSAPSQKNLTLLSTFIRPAVIVIMLCGCVATPDAKEVSINKLLEPRLKPIPLNKMTERQKEVLNIVEGRPIPKRAKMNLFRTLMHHPELSARYFPLGDSVNKAPEIADKDRELIIMRLAWLYQSEYEWAQHYPPALKAGWTATEIERIKVGADHTDWAEFDRTLLRAAQQLKENAFLDDDVWSALNKKYSAEDIMVLITLVSHYHWVAMMTKTLGIEIEKGKQGFKR